MKKKKIILLTENQITSANMLFKSKMSWEETAEGETYIAIGYEYEAEEYVPFRTMKDVEILSNFFAENNLNICVKGVLTVNKKYNCYL